MPPTCLSPSRTTAGTPCFDSSYAAVNPAGPPPMITTFRCPGVKFDTRSPTIVLNWRWPDRKVGSHERASQGNQLPRSLGEAPASAYSYDNGCCLGCARRSRNQFLWGLSLDRLSLPLAFPLF